MIREKNLMYQNDCFFDPSENVVTGSEICPIHILTNKNREIINTAIQQSNAIRFVTPITPQKYVNSIYNMICNLPSETKVTFNDYGLLFRCKELIFNNDIIPVLGRIITHSLIDCPWYYDIVKHDSKYIDVLKKNNMNFDSKIEFMKTWRIQEIEVNNCTQDSVFYFHQNGIKVAQYSSYNILSVSRTCFHAKLSRISTTNCYEYKTCGSLNYNIKMTNLYSNKTKLLAENCHSIIDWSDTKVFGTALFIKNKLIHDNIDFLIT